MRNIIVVFLLFIFGLVGKLYPQVSTAEKQALQDLYNATNGPNWKSETDTDTTNDWDFNGDVTNAWHGVTLENGHVVELDLRINDLSGIIPPELGNLSSITYLSLSGNQLSGGIPVELANLTNLSYLNLYNNGLSGGVPLGASIGVADPNATETSIKIYPSGESGAYEYRWSVKYCTEPDPENASICPGNLTPPFGGWGSITSQLIYTSCGTGERAVYWCQVKDRVTGDTYEASGNHKQEDCSNTNNNTPLGLEDPQ